jgi:hypothetical protein
MEEVQELRTVYESTRELIIEKAHSMTEFDLRMNVLPLYNQYFTDNLLYIL